MRYDQHILRPVFGAILVSIVTVPCALAQPTPAVQLRPFMFSVSTIPSETRHATVHLDSGFGERPFDVSDTDGVEQRFGVQATLGNGLTFVGRLGVSSVDQGLRSSQQGELLYSIFQAPRSSASLAAGFGLRHESAGINVLLARVAAGRSFNAWRIDGNALFERPLSIDRDAVDLITSFGVARQLLPALHAGIEVIGEDLEGFWEPNEAEGGARLLVGPSLRIAPPARRWQLSVAGGPLLHATRSGRSSDATRGLPSSSGRTGYAVRMSVGYAF